MKRQILLGLTLMLICFLIGGLYIISAIRGATGQLENAVTMHYIDDLGNELKYSIELIQADLLLLGSPHKKDAQSVQEDLSRLRELIASRMDQPRGEKAQRLITAIHDQATDYVSMAAAALAEDVAPQAALAEKLPALRMGKQLLEDVSLLSRDIGANLHHRSQDIYRDITRLSHLITFLVIGGPIAVLLLTAYFLRRFTGSMTILVQATESLGKGSLGYRIDEDLQYEFKQLADSFNGMAMALQRQRDELESVRQLYQALFNCAGDGIFILDLSEGRQGDIVSANPAAAVMHGYATDALGKMNIADLTLDEKCPERLQCALPGSWGQYEVWRRKKGGSTFLAEVNLGQLEVQGKKYAIAFSRDITQRREEEKKLQRANHLAAVGEMAAGLAHEIKNPLAGIRVSLEVLGEELELSEEDSELFVRLVAETHRVEKLLKGLLNYARPPQLQYTTFDLAQLINNVVKNLSNRGKNGSLQNLSFVCDFAADLPLLEADSAQLQQVILNILLNAIEAMPDGGQVAVHAALQGDDHILMTFTDQGIGLPADKRETIFQPFYTSKNKGTGLGLAISQRIIEEHEGSISATADAGGGTVISIVLPVRRKRQED